MVCAASTIAFTHLWLTPEQPLYHGTGWCLLSWLCCCCVQVMSSAVPADPDQVEALVGSPVEAPGGPLWTAAAGSSNGSESEPQEPAVAVAVSAAVA